MFYNINRIELEQYRDRQQIQFSVREKERRVKREEQKRRAKELEEKVESKV